MDDYEESDPTQGVIAQLISQFLQKRNQGESRESEHVFKPQARLKSDLAPLPPKQDLTAEQIDVILKKYPDAVKMLQPLPDDFILHQLRVRFPDFSESTYKTALDQIKKIKVKK